jgi:hypothetical protein
MNLEKENGDEMFKGHGRVSSHLQSCAREANHSELL